jgi:16S rRNA C967 or C1407 C5-methylase (RsmB/RsmF family)/NOL1/NOP2/fmu family ribosome biogenesis protein
MRELLGPDEAADLEASLSRPAVTGLRVNTLKLSAEEFESLSSWPLAKVPWCPSGFALEAHARTRPADSAPGRNDLAARAIGSGVRPGLHPFHAAGLYYLQEPSAMAAAEALAPRAGELVLDLAAAPGGKSTHVAALLGDSGLLLANDVHGGRARELSRNLERWGSRRALVTNAAPADLALRWGALFDAVLLDAPCSGEGMFRKTPEAALQWSREAVTACALRQGALLKQAAQLVRPGGRMLYSTCTLSPEENEQAVTRFLDEVPGWELQDPALTGASNGRPDWAGKTGRARELARSVRLWPHRQQGEGHFLALLVRSSSAREVSTAGARTGRGAGRPDRLGPAEESWRAFVTEHMTADPLPGHRLAMERDGLYAVPPLVPELSGLPVLRSGLWLGSLERGRFEPSHALALALRGSEARDSVDLRPEDPELSAYLAGAELERPGPDGWTLITVSGHPLGWGRRRRGIVKNRYPKGLRRS